MTESNVTNGIAMFGESQKNRIFFDMEFHEDGKTIDLISVGMIKESGETLYRESSEYDEDRATPWLKTNVIPHLVGGKARATRSEIADAILDFAGKDPEFWAYYADYDWVCLCQLYGKMIDLPEGWPMYCRDLKQYCDSLGNPKLPDQPEKEHHALSDAVWVKNAFYFLQIYMATLGNKDQ